MVLPVTGSTVAAQGLDDADKGSSSPPPPFPVRDSTSGSLPARDCDEDAGNDGHPGETPHGVLGELCKDRIHVQLLQIGPLPPDRTRDLALERPPDQQV